MKDWLGVIVVLLRLGTVVIVFVSFMLSPHVAGKLVVLRRRRRVEFGWRRTRTTCRRGERLLSILLGDGSMDVRMGMMLLLLLLLCVPRIK